MIPPPPISTLFPYTTLFRSDLSNFEVLVKPGKREKFRPTANDYAKVGIKNSSKMRPDRKSTRLNFSHTVISYAVFCLKKKKKQARRNHTEEEHEELARDDE